MNFQYDCTVSKNYDVEIYQQFKEKILEKFPSFEIENELVDPLDGTAVQEFKKGSDCIKLVNDFLVGAVYIESTVPIPDFSV